MLRHGLGIRSERLASEEEPTSEGNMSLRPLKKGIHAVSPAHFSHSRTHSLVPQLNSHSSAFEGLFSFLSVAPAGSFGAKSDKRCIYVCVGGWRRGLGTEMLHETINLALNRMIHLYQTSLYS